MTHHTPETINELSTNELVRLYNHLTGQNIKRFSDRATGIKRTLNAIGFAETAQLESEDVCDIEKPVVVEEVVEQPAVEVEQPVVDDEVKVLEYTSFDGARKVKKFLSTAKAKAWAINWIGHDFQLGTTYAISGDGVGKITTLSDHRIADILFHEGPDIVAKPTPKADVRSERRNKLTQLFSTGEAVTLAQICDELACDDKAARNALDHARNSGLVITLVDRKTWKLA